MQTFRGVIGLIKCCRSARPRKEFVCGMTFREASSSCDRPWREAASLIIAAPTTADSPKSKFSSDYSVLFLKRASKSSFYPNAYVYPGGVVDKADSSAKWLDLFATVDPGFAETVVKDFFVKNVDDARSALFPADEESLFAGVLPNEIAFRICAIRETFEESGLLILTSKPSSRDGPNEIRAKSVAHRMPVHETEEWRKAVHNDANEFFNLCIKLGHVPDIWSLKEWSQWLTPLFPNKAKKKLKRFNTVFYSCCLQEFPSYSTYDSDEMSDSVWRSPAEILKRFSSKEAFLAPPQILESLRLLNFCTIEDLNNYTCMRALKGLEIWVPYIAFTKDSKLIEILPGDELYPKDYDYTSEIGEWPVLDKTSDEILSSLSKFRVDWGVEPSQFLSSVECTAILKYGQVSPVLQNVQDLSSKL